MVVIKRPLEHFDRFGFQNNTGASLIESSRISGHILQGRNMNSMIGVLYQLSALSQTAIEIFNSLSESATGTFDRINALNTRIQQINNKLPEYERFMHDNNSKLLFSASGYELSEANIAVLYRKDHSNISKENNPLPLNVQYMNACLPAPEFSPLLDQLHELNLQQANSEGNEQQPQSSDVKQGPLPKYKKCIEAYTDANFFFNEWAKRELERLKKAKLKRKEERKRQRLERQNVTATKEKKQVKQMKIHRKKYNSEGQIIDSGSAPSSMQRMASSPNMTTTSYQQQQMDYSNNNNNSNYPPTPSNPPQHQQYDSSPRMNHSYDSSPSFNVPTPPPNSSRNVPPPPMMNGGGYGSSTTNSNGYSTSPPMMMSSGGGYGVPPPTNVPPPPSVMGGNVPPPPPNVMNVPPPPPSNNFVVTPPPVPATTGEGNIDILKTVESNKSQMNRVAVTGRANLLDEIRTGKTLRSVAERKLEPKKDEGSAMSVADILSKKFEKVMGDSDDEDSDTDFSDSDW
ncbi:hypothetical protein FDP41_000493 [Naegleria fowleri]|uniref:WH2 domain-containing protein n=1 Tax=Naegleria fowleri TaxID=5763 RepID=A0A6A5CDF6_NAEFO|nr:uncharacterized protein FDP41_000493 [Naegleria fowleri]KAF0984594.1 hypothetical protein FDP41_000493 [Naegleria fowleri]